MNNNLLIGFIGQGYIGKNYADDMEERGYQVIRYDRHAFASNKDRVKECDVVFIAVPTPTTPQGFDYSTVQDVLSLVGPGKIAVIKSTIQVGTTKKLQAMYPDIIVMHSPEFLTEKTAAEDARHPDRNIVGITDITNPDLVAKGNLVISLLAKAPYELVCQVENAELIKYGNNCWFYFKVVFMNILYDLAEKYNLDYEVIKTAMSYDPRVGSTHLDVFHKSGRGAGGHCFIKDFESFIEMLSKQNLTAQQKVCEELRNINLEYLKSTNKDQDLVKEIYG